MSALEHTVNQHLDLYDIVMNETFMRTMMIVMIVIHSREQSL